jgi:hypothetical protein
MAANFQIFEMIAGGVSNPANSERFPDRAISFAPLDTVNFRPRGTTDYARKYGAGLTGPASVVRRRLFDPELAAAGVETVYPSDVEKNELNRIISTELVKGLFTASSRDYLIGLASRLGARADAVILGCTELPLVVTEDNCEAPLIDTTRLLARAALEASLAEHRQRRESVSASA